ncbi:hypothetical protein BGZ94_006137, partial [Podila epigama]
AKEEANQKAGVVLAACVSDKTSPGTERRTSANLQHADSAQCQMRAFNSGVDASCDPAWGTKEETIHRA